MFPDVGHRRIVFSAPWLRWCWGVPKVWFMAFYENFELTVISLDGKFEHHYLCEVSTVPIDLPDNTGRRSLGPSDWVRRWYEAKIWIVHTKQWLFDGPLRWISYARKFIMILVTSQLHFTVLHINLGSSLKSIFFDMLNTTALRYSHGSFAKNVIFWPLHMPGSASLLNEREYFTQSVPYWFWDEQGNKTVMNIAISWRRAFIFFIWLHYYRREAWSSFLRRVTLKFEVHQ